jgi:RHS repeat-associated protein
MKNHDKLSAGRFAACVVALICTCSSASAANQQPSDLLQRISHSFTFPQPILWVGDQPPDEAENQALWAALEAARTNRLAEPLQRVDEFISVHPTSAWTPSLRANLGAYYRQSGRYTLALNHLQAAWSATKDASQGPARLVADQAYADYVSFLADLGRSDELSVMFKEGAARSVGRGPLQQAVNAAREGYQLMLADPSASYKCGTFALNQVALALRGRSFNSAAILQAPSPSMGFSMTKLVELAAANKLGLIAVRRPKGEAVVVPCVVHWKQGHYAAILRHTEERYELVDAAQQGKAHWVSARTLEAETSGYFLIPAAMNPGWPVLTQEETDLVLGKGGPNNIIDGDDGECSGGPGGGGGGAGGGGAHPPLGGGVGSAQVAASAGQLACPTGGCGATGDPASQDGEEDNGDDSCSCEGMAVWGVSEPYISLWLHDAPLPSYQPGKGAPAPFKLSYKQRSERAVSSQYFNVGGSWNCGWLSYVTYDPRYGTPAGYSMAGGADRNLGVPETVVTNPDGSKSTQYRSDFYTKTRFQTISTPYSVLTNINRTFPNGGVERYNYFSDGATEGRAYLSEKADSAGHTTRFSYTSASGIVKLVYVIDPDGHTNSLSYTNADFPAQITGVTDPFNRTCTLQYDSSGSLTNIIDAAGLSSGFRYDEHGWITNLTTPYGTTRFQFAESSFEGVQLGGTNINRSVLVIQPDGGKHLFVYRDNSSCLDASGTTPYLPSAYSGSQVPSNTPVGVAEGCSLDNVNMFNRNSFYWGPLQYSALSTTNMYSFTTNDYNRARLKHWTHNANWFGNLKVVGVLSLNRQPCPDPAGASWGQMTWYDYYGKNSEPYIHGTNSHPDCVLRVLPDGSYHYVWYLRDQNQRATNVISTYSVGDTAYTRTNRYVYSADGTDLLRVYGPDGNRQWAYGYLNHLVTYATNALGEVTTYQYNGDMQLVSVQRPSGLTTTYDYLGSGFYQGWLERTTDLEIQRTNSYTYADGLVHTHTDERGLTLTSTWDALARLRRVDYPDGTFITNGYSKLDLVRAVDRMGFENHYGYDAARRLVAVTNALGNYTLYNYCSCGGLDSLFDAAGNYSYFYYDNAGRQTAAVYPDGYAVTNRFNLLGQLTNIIDSAGVSVTNWFNNQGLRCAVSNAVGAAWVLAYDAQDRSTNSIDANAVAVASVYDDVGRVLNRAYPDGGVELFGYSPAGLTTYSTKVGFATRYGYDAAARKTSETNANNEIIRYTYDAAGDLLTLTDGKNQVTTWHYDQYGRVSNKLDQASVEILRYAYDADGRLTNRWSKAKGSTVYRYDPVGNLTNIAYSASGSVTLGYDAMNRRSSMLDSVGTTVYSYDAAGQLLTENGPFDSDTVTNTYSNRRRVGLLLQQPSGSWTNGFGWDGAGRLTNVISPAGTFGYAYDVLRKRLPASIALANGSHITNNYDSVARLLAGHLRAGGGSLLDKHEYLYNLAGQRTNETRLDASSVDYRYDGVGQLVVADSSVNAEDRGYLYDTAWNLSRRTNNGATATFSVNGLNELTNGSALGPMEYDANGNPTNRAAAAMSYEYDDENRLSGVQVYYLDDSGVAQGWRTEFKYDGLGRLRRRWEFTPEQGNSPTRAPATLRSGGLWYFDYGVRYVYDGLRVIQERDESNNPLVSYTRGRDLSGTFEVAGGIGGLLARSSGYSAGSWTSHACYFADGNGNVTSLLDANQSVVASYRYDPFGNTISKSGSLADANIYRFSSKEIHLNSGMYYYLYRFYDPNLQRWINADPIKERGGINLYSYVRQAPNYLVDPFGLQDPLNAGGWGPRLPPIQTPGDMSDINCESNHGEVTEGDGSLGDMFLDWLAHLLNPSTPEQETWDRTWGLSQPPPGVSWLIPGRPPTPSPPTTRRRPQCTCTYGGQGGNAPPTTVILQ